MKFIKSLIVYLLILVTLLMPVKLYLGVYIPTADEIRVMSFTRPLLTSIVNLWSYGEENKDNEIKHKGVVPYDAGYMDQYYIITYDGTDEVDLFIEFGALIDTLAFVALIILLLIYALFDKSKDLLKNYNIKTIIMKNKAIIITFFTLLFLPLLFFWSKLIISYVWIYYLVIFLGSILYIRLSLKTAKLSRVILIFFSLSGVFALFVSTISNVLRLIALTPSEIKQLIHTDCSGEMLINFYQFVLPIAFIIMLFSYVFSKKYWACVKN